MAENTYIRDFLENMRSRKYSDKSVLTYKYPMTDFFSFLDARGLNKLQEVTLSDLEKYRLRIIEKGFKPGSVRVYLKAVRKFFEYLEDRSLIFINPARELATPRLEKRLPEVPPVEEMEKLISVIDISSVLGIRDRAMIETAYSCGLRLNELTSLAIFSLDLPDSTLRVLGKGRRERIIPLTVPAVRWLEKYISESRPALLRNNINDNALWISKYTTKMTDIAVQKTIQLYAEKAQLKGRITIHSIRRACATHMLKNGAHPVQVQMLLGHASLSTLSRYLRLSIDELRDSHRKSKLGR